MIKEIYQRTLKETTVSVVQTKIDAIKRKNIIKTGLRVYDGSSIGIAGAIGKFDETALEKKATENLGLKIPYPYKVSEKCAEKVIRDVPPIREEELISEIEEILAVLRKNHSLFSFSHKVKLIESIVSITNSVGLDLFSRNLFYDFTLLIKENSSSSIFDGVFSVESRKYNRKEILRLIDEFCNVYQSKVQRPKEKRVPVIFSTNEFLPVSKLTSELSGWMVGTKSSILTEKIGTQAFNPHFSFVQTRHPDETMSPFFDAEGVVNKNYEYDLIKDGKIIHPFTDKKTAAKFSLPLTGSADSEYDGVPMLGAGEVKIVESAHSLKKLLAGRIGIHAMLCSGGNFTSKGDFGTPVQLAFLHDGEKYTGCLPQIKISSSLFEMFGDRFLGVSKDFINPLSLARYLVIEMDVEKLG
ncbi:MAG: metallopeptidase TldD-related protein [Candidatus Ozemobacteraceae bacterium]